MLLKVGQLARQISLSVRTLHHYEEIGLLSPSVRTDAGHRLYNTKDISRLYRIQALKQLGLSLLQISELIQQDVQDLPAIITQQITHLDREIVQATQLKNRLLALQNNLKSIHEPGMTNWLDTLALMNIYERYLTADEIEELNGYAQTLKQELEHDWPKMVNKLKTMMEQNVAPDTQEAKEFVIRWTEMLERLAGHNPDLLLKIYSMSSNDLEMQVESGISPAMNDYLGRIMGALHRDIFARYLTAEQMQIMEKHQRENREQWLPLITEVRAQMQLGISPESEVARVLALKWKALFEASVSGGDAEITARLRQAYDNEPLLVQGTGLDKKLFKFIRQAMDHL
ncbi:MerR family transcriptional regulator [Cellvibrio mixtus]|uniref:MerR family transcriptional regulator n=1 Tax=Cellvibrio mixtus TaxID=39650 RepID=UPI000587B4DB|nr:MerR family transcriptional regulator [Cellvibrio mixtus]